MQKDAPLNFDYLRLFLAVTVMTGHVGLPQLQLGPLWNSELAVFCFFCISGYLIALSFIKRPDIGSYVKNRFARIYPPIVAVVVVMIGFGVLMGFDQAYMRSVFSLALFQDWLVLAGEGHKIFAHGAFWTLVLEAQFYIALPFAIVAWRKWPIRTIAALAVVYFASHFSRRYLENDLLMLAFRDNLFTVAQFFIAGVFAAMHGKKVWEHSWFWWAAVPAAIVVYAVATLWANQFTGLLLPAAVAALVLAAARISRLVSGRKEAFFGDLSYGVYLYHFPVIFMLEQLDPRYAMDLATPNKIIAVTVALSLASWWLLERWAVNAARGSAHRVLNADRDVGPSPQVGGEILQYPVIRPEYVEGVRAFDDAAKASGGA